MWNWGFVGATKQFFFFYLVRPDMTEKLLTGTLSLNTKKKKKKKKKKSFICKTLCLLYSHFRLRIE